MPPVVTGSIVGAIGLVLAPIAISSASGIGPGNADGSAFARWIALITVVAVGLCAVYAPGLARRIPILLGAIAGYIVYYIAANVMALGPGIDFSRLGAAAWFDLGACAREGNRGWRRGRRERAERLGQRGADRSRRGHRRAALTAFGPGARHVVAAARAPVHRIRPACIASRDRHSAPPTGVPTPRTGVAQRSPRPPAHAGSMGSPKISSARSGRGCTNRPSASAVRVSPSQSSAREMIRRPSTRSTAARKCNSWNSGVGLR